MEKNNGTPFVFYPSFLSQLDRIKNNAVRLLVLDSIARYGCYGEKPDFSNIDQMGLLDAAFEPIMNVIDAAKDKYDVNKEMQSLKQKLRWGSITKDEYEARMKSLKPSLEDIQAYCSEMGYSFDPQRFLDFYESKGWMVGKTKMKDWKAALRGWNSRQPEFDFKPQQPPSKDARRGTDVSASSGKDYEGDFISSNPQGWDEDDRKF